MTKNEKMNLNIFPWSLNVLMGIFIIGLCLFYINNCTIITEASIPVLSSENVQLSDLWVPIEFQLIESTSTTAKYRSTSQIEWTHWRWWEEDIPYITDIIRYENKLATYMDDNGVCVLLIYVPYGSCPTINYHDADHNGAIVIDFSPEYQKVFNLLSKHGEKYRPTLDSNTLNGEWIVQNGTWEKVTNPEFILDVRCTNDVHHYNIQFVINIETPIDPEDLNGETYPVESFNLFVGSIVVQEDVSMFEPF